MTEPEPRHRCVICSKANRADGCTTCAACVDWLDDDLAAIVTLTRAAAHHVMRGSAPQGGGGGKPGSKPPLDVVALDDSMAAHALPCLESWERMIREWRFLAPYGVVSALRTSRGATTPPLTLEGVVGFLRSQLPILVETVDFPIEELAGEVRAIARSLARYDAERTDRKPGVPIHCPGDHRDADGRQCGHIVRTDGTDTTWCPGCGRTWTPDELLDAGAFELMPAAVLVLLSDEPAAARKRIANLAQRGKLTAHEWIDNPNGGPRVPLYRLGEYRALTVKAVTA